MLYTVSVYYHGAQNVSRKNQGRARETAAVFTITLQIIPYSAIICRKQKNGFFFVITDILEDLE